MGHYFDVFIDGYRSYADYLWREVTQPHWKSYFYWLLAISLVFFLLEILAPWRQEQKKFFRQDFWLDAFYMFFNFFLFSLLIFNAASDVVVEAFTDLLGMVGIEHLTAITVSSWPVWAQLATLFVLRDFIQWNIHRLLHGVPALWEYHKVHHSVLQMGFAAHLRYHWMENVVYRSIEYLPLAMIGFGIDDFFVVHVFALAVGHFNHSNFRIPLGPLKYVLNNPQMHIWHHVEELPKDRPTGMNFGISLSLWDYLFGTALIPSDGRDIKLGFQRREEFPDDFVRQNLYGLGLFPAS
jgi:sterol desaturase/sphingolipid hydroxylase (fatty acid hydroxylase superfamily)